MMTKTCVRLGACALFALGAQPGLAAVTTGTLSVSATVVDTCLVAATPLAFGNLDATVTTTELAPATVSIVCTAAKPNVTVTLDGGANAASGVRRMAAGANLIPYQVYADSAHANPVAAGGQIYAGGVAAVTPTTFNLYGSVAAGGYAAGAYSDAATITVTY